MTDTIDELVGEDGVCETDLKISKLSGRPAIVHKFQRLYNPVKYYHELRSVGVGKRSAKILAIIYEKQVYSIVEEVIKRIHDYE